MIKTAISAGVGLAACGVDFYATPYLEDSENATVAEYAGYVVPTVAAVAAILTRSTSRAVSNGLAASAGVMVGQRLLGAPSSRVKQPEAEVIVTPPEETVKALTYSAVRGAPSLVPARMPARAVARRPSAVRALRLA